MRLTDLEKQLFEQLMEQVIQDLSNNSCNDLPIEVTFENRDQIRKLIRDMNPGNDHDSVEQRETEIEDLAEKQEGDEFFMIDWLVLCHLRDKILKS